MNRGIHARIANQSQDIMLHLAFMQKRIHLVLMFFLAGLATSWAQNVTGVVRDASGNALPGAFVSASNEAQEVIGVTNSMIDGRYTLNLEQWSGTRVVLRCSYIGMENREEALGTLTAGKSYSIDWTLKESAELIGQVVVSAGRFEQSANEVTVSIDVIPPRIIE